MPTGVAEVFGAQWPRVVATLRADLGDLDLAEDAAQHAFTTAAERWPVDGMPDTPGAWLVTVARRWAIDQARRDLRWARRVDDVRAALELPQRERGAIADDLLAMIFGCCHRALDEPARVALTLRYVVGLPTAGIAKSFLVAEATMAKRLVRAKKKIAAANIPFEVPEREHLGDSLHDVLKVVYVIFTQGHASPTGGLIRGDLCDEARWLAGTLCDLMPDEPETWGSPRCSPSPTHAGPRGSTPTARSCCSATRTGRCGTPTPSLKDAGCSSARSGRAASARTRSRRPSPPRTPTQPRSRRPTGRPSAGCMPCSARWSRRPS
ncbi:hypothetical protein GCM10025877_15330 [Agromyces mangrovi Wang et al. 2018]|nr:DUF6596 domain-containing protein [Agromyces mangrovi]BDZ64595.1 hypothetical protein GCM10025877_15330 [Agromyces mangrovi]